MATNATENKICIYAICKNEIANVEQWLNNMSEADYIVVLDTGSTDGTYEKLKSDPRVTRVEQKIFKPWRFDVARNESMKLVPDDANILLCTDFDEVFEPGWGDVIRSNWKPGITRGHYLYAWSHNEKGIPGDVFVYDKMHTRDYKWIFPVHEVLTPIDPSFKEYVLDCGDKVYLHHLQDKTKARGNYCDLLKLSVQENPENMHCRMLLAREYLIQNNPEQARIEYLEVLKHEDTYKRNQIALETYGRLADLCEMLDHDIDGVMKYCYKFMEIDDTYREPYFIMAESLASRGKYIMAIGLVETAMSHCTHKYTWIERAPCWQDEGYTLLGYCYQMTGELQKSLENYQKAFEINPNRKETVDNLIHVINLIANNSAK